MIGGYLSFVFISSFCRIWFISARIMIFVLPSPIAARFCIFSISLLFKPLSNEPSSMIINFTAPFFAPSIVSKSLKDFAVIFLTKPLNVLLCVSESLSLGVYISKSKLSLILPCIIFIICNTLRNTCCVLPVP